MPERINILLVDDNPAKLMSYEAVLADLDENLIRATSGREALEQLLRCEIAVILIDVCMPDIDGFQLAELIREHPRYRETAILFISAIQFEDVHRIRGYKLGAVDYVPVPIVAELLRAKVKVFVDLYRKTQLLEALNQQLETRVHERTAALEAANARLRLALDVARLGTSDWNLATGEVDWSDRYSALFGYRPGEVVPSVEAWLARVHPADRAGVEAELERSRREAAEFHSVFRIRRPDGTMSWCEARSKSQVGARGLPGQVMTIAVDISDHKLAEERQRLMTQELHHRVKNTLATVQAIATLSRRFATDLDAYYHALTRRIAAVSKTHTLLVTNNWQRIDVVELLRSELSSFFSGPSKNRLALNGVPVILPSDFALTFGLVVHELTTNAAKHGSLSIPDGCLDLNWSMSPAGNGRGIFAFEWRESGGPAVRAPTRKGFGSVLIERLFEAEDGRITVDYAASGVVVRLSKSISLDRN